MADPPAPTADNLRIAQQLLSAMSQISVQLENQTKAYRAQAELLDGIVKAQAAMGNIDPSKMQEISDALNKGQKSADELANAIKGGTDNAAGQNEKLQQGLATLQKTVIVMGEFVNGFKAGFNLSKALLGNLLRIGSVGLKGIMGVGKALLSIPGSILDFFQSNAGGGTDPWREALEELRDKFGSLKVGTSKAVLGMMDNVNQFNDSGLQLGRVFGYGRAGAAAAMKEFMKIAEEMGPLAMRFMDATKGISGQLLVLTKATGLTGEALRSLQISADNGGESVATATQRMSVELVRAQRTFNISVKEMGRDLEVMMKDVGTFGVMTRDTMIKTSVYARKLGLSMEALKKVMDKTLNFEDTANMAGGLAEAFNMNIDAMKMMKAQTPVEKLDQLREAFFRTGKNIDQMSIAERKHLSNLTGLSEEETRIAFAQKNRAMTGAALDAQMKKSQKTQITQEQAMHELADSIKRLTQSGSGMKGGFFEMFFKGFEAGITRSRDFRKIAREIQQDLRIVWRAGRDVGRMFVMFFPGIQNMFGGLKDMLNPAKFRQLMDKIRNIFGAFFIELQTDPRKGFEHFMERMKKAFFDMFSSDKAGGSQFLQGLKKFWGAIGNIFVQGLRWLLTKTKDGIKFILDSIKNILHNPRGIKAGFKELFDSLISPDTSAGVESGIMSLLGEIMQTLKTEILPVLQELWTVIVDFFKDPAVQNTIKNIGMAILGYMFGPAVFMSIIRGSLAIGFMLLKTAFTAWIEQVGTAAAWEIIKKGMGRLFSGLFSATTAVYLLIAAFAALFVGFAVAPEATGKIVDWITDFIGGLGEMIGKLVGYIIKGAVYLIGGIIYTFFGFAFDTKRWLGYADRAAIALLQAFASVGMMIVKFFGDMVAGVLEALGFPGAAAAVRNFTKSVVDEIKDFIKNATEYFDIFSQMIEGGLVAASDSISEFLQPLISLFFEVGSVISDLFSSIWGGIKSLFNTISEFVGGFIDAIIKPIYRTISSIGRSMSMILDMIISGIISFAGTVVDILTWPGRQIFALFSWAFDQIMSILSPFIETAKGYFTEFSDYVSGKFDSLVGGISSAWDTVVSTISEGIDSFGSGIDRIVNFISIPFTKAGELMNSAGALITRIIDHVKHDFDILVKYLSDHNPFKLIERGAEAAEAIVRRIHGNSMNTTINKDLNKIDPKPINAIGAAAQANSNTVSQSFSQAARNSNTHLQQIQRNSTTASAAAATAVAPNPQALQQASAGISQASTAVNQLQNENIQNNAALLGLFGQLRDVINGMVNFVKDAFRDLTPAQATNVKAGVEVISSLFTSIKTIVDIVGGLKGSNGAIDAYTTVIAPLFGDNGILSYLFDPSKHGEATAFKNMMKSGGLIEGFTTSLPANFNDQIIKLTSVFNFIKSIGESISALNGSGAPAGDIYSRIINPLIGANGILSYLFDPIKHSEATAFKNMFKTHGLIGGFLAVLPPDFSQGITKLTNFFNSIKTMFESVKAISDMPNSAALTTSPLAVPLANLALIIDNIKQDNITANGVTSVNPLKNPRTYFDPLTAILAGIAGKETILTNVKNVVTELLSSAKAIAEQPIVPTSPDLGTSLANMTSVLGTIDSYFGPADQDGSINNLLDNIHRNTKGRVSHDLSVVVERYNSLSRDLARMNAIDIDASLTRLNDGLGRNRVVQIENAAANITINLDVKLRTEDIETALFTRSNKGAAPGPGGSIARANFVPRSHDTAGH